MNNILIGNVIRSRKTFIVTKSAGILIASIESSASVDPTTTLPIGPLENRTNNRYKDVKNENTLIHC